MYTKKLQGNMSYAFQLLGISYVQIHGIAKKKKILICVPLPRGKRAKILDTSVAVSTMG